MRKNFGAKPICYPRPMFILAAYDESGAPNAMNAAWGGISGGKIDPAKLRPITFDPVNNDYRVLGGKVGNAFGDGLKLR